MADSAPYPEEVTPGNPTSPVGLCTLWTRQERILRGVPRDLYALCGNLYSLWGISVLVRGVLARPTLRYLVVCGVDYGDTGRALVALAVQGLAADGTLPGTTVRLADDLDEAALGRFRAQVSVVDLRGCTDAARVAAAIQNLPPPPPLGAATIAHVLVSDWTPPSLPPPGPNRQAVAPTSPDAPGALSLPTASPRAAHSQPGAEPAAALAAPRFHPDPLGNFLIAVGGGLIVAAHATTQEGPTGARFVGRTA